MVLWSMRFSFRRETIRVLYSGPDLIVLRGLFDLIRSGHKSKVEVSISYISFCMYHHDWFWKMLRNDTQSPHIWYPFTFKFAWNYQRWGGGWCHSKMCSIQSITDPHEDLPRICQANLPSAQLSHSLLQNSKFPRAWNFRECLLVCKIFLHANITCSPILNLKPPLESWGALPVKKSGTIPAYELPVPENHENFMSWKLHLLSRLICKECSWHLVMSRAILACSSF